MRKNVLILILCAPLLWIAGKEGLRLYNVSTWSSAKPESTEDNPLPRPEVLEKAKQSAGAIIDLPDAVTAVVLRLDPPPHGPPQESPVGNIVVAHAKKRAERAAEVEKAKDDGQEVENQIVEILKKMRGPDGRAVVSNRDLEGKLEEYKDKVHDPDLIASAAPRRTGRHENTISRRPRSTGNTKRSTSGRPKPPARNPSAEPCSTATPPAIATT